MTPEANTGLPWTEDDATFWQQAIARARQRRLDLLGQWDAQGNLDRYAAPVIKDNYDVNAGKDFADVERKKAGIFYDLPQVTLVPDPGTPAPALLLHQEYLNTIMGTQYLDVKATCLKTVQDALVVIQPALTEIGYHAVTVEVTMPPQPGAILGLNAPVPQVVHEAFFWDHLSPRASLIPVEFRDTAYDKSPWIGYDWRKPKSQVIREFDLEADWSGGGDQQTEKPYFEVGGTDDGDQEPMVSGSRIWYRAHLRDPNVSHPLVIRQFDLIDGVPEPQNHKACPYQEIDLATGRLTPDSIVGYPFHPLTLRDLTDSPYVQADLTVTAPLTRELNKFRTNMILKRDGSKLHVLYDSSIVDEDMRGKIESGKAPRMIPVLAGALAQGKDNIMLQVPNLELGRENYVSQDIIERDREAILGISANQQGGTKEGSQTATEASLIQRNMDARFEQERQRDQVWFLKGAQKLSALILRYGDRIALDVLGPQRGQQWLQAKQAGAFGRFTFEIVMNSGSYVDIGERKREDMQLYNMTAKDPSTQRGVVLQRLATDFGLDPATWLAVTPPEKEPAPPSISISVKPEDLDPVLPSYIATYAVLKAAGIDGLPPPQATLTAPAPPMPGQAVPEGMAEKMPRLNQAQSDLTGKLDGAAPEI